MNDKITNPFLKQLITEISGKTAEGRMTDINWGALTEAKKKKSLKKEAAAKKPAPAAPAEEEPKDAAPAPEAAPAEPEAPQAAASGDSDLPDLGGAPEAPAPEAGGADGVDDLGGGDEPAPEASQEDAEAAQADAAKAKAELEKAKDEKDRAEKEIKQQSYIKLGSHAGTQFLLAKLLNHAFKTNTIDELAGEMVQKLKIQTPEDMNAFGEDTSTFRVLPGFPELLSSMKTLATKQPEEETPDEEPLA